MIIKVTSRSGESVTYVDVDSIKLWGFNYCNDSNCDETIHYGVEVPGSDPLQVDYLTFLEVMKYKDENGGLPVGFTIVDIPLPVKKKRANKSAGQGVS